MIENYFKTKQFSRKKITLRICLFFLSAILLLFVSEVNANSDSLKQIWTNVAQPDSIQFHAINEYYKKKGYSQPDSVILWSAYHIELAQQKNLKKEEVKALKGKAIAHSIKGDYDNALVVMNEVVEIYSILNDSIGLAKTYNNLANIHSYRIEYQEAIKFYSKALAFYKVNNLEDAQSSTLMNIGRIHLNISNYNLALEYFDKSLHIYKRLGTENILEVGNIWINIGHANFRKKNYHRALENNQKALNIYHPLKAEYHIASSYRLNAKIYQELNQIDTALFYIQKGLKLHQKLGTNLLILKDQIVLANLIFNTDVNKATKIGEEVLKTASEYHDHSMKIDLYNLLYKCYKKKKNYLLSISMLENYNAYSDSLSIEQDHISFTKKSIQTEYEAQLFNTQLENEQTQSQLKLTQLQKTYTLLFLGSIIILIIIFYYRAKRIILSKEKEVLLHKINHLKELEDTRHQLIQSDKMASLGQLTAGVAHEINNPVNFISNGVRGLKKTLKEYIETPKSDVTDELVEDMNDMIIAIEEGAQRTNNIVKSLRQFSREDAENYTEADIITGLESTFTLLSNKLKQGVFLEKDFEKEAMPIFCFPGQLNQVFMNILLNAIQSIEDSGTIKVKVKEEEENIIISILDNGAGIPDDKKQKIFEPFYTTKGIQEGTGLGLSISYGIVKKHKGSIEVKDNSPKGTQFIISLPKRDDSLTSSIT